VRRLLVLLVLVVAAPVHAAGAAAPTVQARAWIIEDARTGEVLAASNAHARMPIASITKLMTVLVTLEHHKLTDVVDVDPRAAEIGESSANLGPGDELTVSDLVKAALIQSANDAADALALSVAPDFPAFAALMNEKARQLGLKDTHFVRPDGLDAAGHVSSAADVTRLARIVMRIPFVRATVREQTATIAGGRTLHTWDDLLTQFPETIGVKTGHTGLAGWCQVAAARGRGITVYATLLGSPSRSERNDDLESLLVWGLSQFRVVPVVQHGRIYASVSVGYGKTPLGLVAAKPLLAVARVDRPLTETVVAATGVSLPVRRGTVLGHVEIRAGSRVVGIRDLVASRTINKPGVGGRLRWYAGRTLHHLTHLL
jgi:D-alanyl-D-alanine carboxypeptidase (penicillin-binding protein 5/6)